MERTDGGEGRRVTIDRIDQELGLADGAIAILRTGCSTRVLVGGLRFGDALLPEVRQHAMGTGISVVALPGIDDGPVDLLFSRDGKAASR
jgi:hypothetical protein